MTDVDFDFNIYVEILPSIQLIATIRMNGADVCKKHLKVSISLANQHEGS